MGDKPLPAANNVVHVAEQQERGEESVCIVQGCGHHSEERQISVWRWGLRAGFDYLSAVITGNRPLTNPSRSASAG
eukprot:5325472-Prymnesium_polylepis.1